MASRAGEMKKLKIRSQLDHVEKGGILDDCGPSSAACAASWVLEKEITAAQGIKAKAKATGFTEKEGVSDNGSSLWELIKTCKELGANARYPRDWDDCVASAKKGAALIINVDAAKNYPPQAISAWHKRYVGRHKGATYGHMVAAAYDEELGWQFADPTFSGKGKETFAVIITEKDLKAIASSKGDAPFKRVIIVKK
jgi:hypothetical protein